MATLIREDKPADGYGAGLLPQHEGADGTYKATGENNPLPMLLQLVKGLVPTQMQEQLTPQDKVATAFSIGMGITSIVATVPVTGYTTIGFESYASVSHAHKTVLWASPDGTTQCGSLSVATDAVRGRNLIADCPGEFVVIEIQNNHTAAVTYDVWTRKMNR